MPTIQQSPEPNPDLRSLDRLVGTWQVSGEAQGQVRYERSEGGFFLMQHFDLVHGGRKIKGSEPFCSCDYKALKYYRSSRRAARPPMNGALQKQS
jgi:hypothetical protein